MREKINKLCASIIALAFVLCAFVFSPPDVFAGQTRQANKSVCDFSQTEKTKVAPSPVPIDTNAVQSTINDSIDFRVTRQYSPPITRRTLPKTDNYKGLNRQRPEQPPNRS